MSDSGAAIEGFCVNGYLVMERTEALPTVLVVEDYADSRQMLRLLLEDLDYAVLTAATGNEALAVAPNNHIDLILTDYGLPDMTGPTVIRRLRRLRRGLRRVPTIMLTAFDGYEYRNLADEAGCDAFLIKPPDFDILKETIDRLLRESQTEPETRSLDF